MNVQGRTAQLHHTTFLHAELSPAARGDGAKGTQAEAALSGLLTTWSATGRGPATR
ncbi:hypothetical protein O1L60_01380 [Streptomyces diastatochromogenes]|nr:hypothetical protein [Streptomyces diastatochromogenes]